MTPEQRILRLENAFSTLVELARTQSERIDESDRRTEFLAELAKTQSERTDGVVELIRAQSERTDEYGRRMEELVEAQKRTEAHLSVLATVVEGLGRAQALSVNDKAPTEKALTRLTE